MAKLSLSYALKNKRRINIITLISCLVLVFCLGLILVAKNPWKTEAAITIDGKDIAITSGCGSVILSARAATQDISTTSCGNFPLPEDANLTLDGAISVIESSDPGRSLKLNNLTITNGASLTHDSLTLVEMQNCDSNNNYSIIDSDDIASSPAFCADARAKKVDITASQTITLLNGGKIDVDGKGYLGGSMSAAGSAVSCNWSAYGPGRGGNCEGDTSNLTDEWSAAVNFKSGIGASFGGRGDRSFDLAATNVGDIYNYREESSNEVEFGSGGGAIARAIGPDFVGTEGGDGGGRVVLTTPLLTIKPNSYITADGSIGYVPGYTQQDISAGGGSGGAIVIKAGKIDMSEVKSSFGAANYPITNIYEKFLATAAGGKNTTERTTTDGSSHYGSDGVIRIEVQTTSVDNLFQLSAQGGRSCGASTDKYCSGKATVPSNGWTKIDGSGGGGGWIVLEGAGDVQNVSINKVLNPIDRDGRDDFNPYALKSNDTIGVDLNILNMTPGQTYKITDDLLTTPGLSTVIKCAYVPDSGSPDKIEGDTLIWNVTSDDTGSTTISYQCKVQ